MVLGNSIACTTPTTDYALIISNTEGGSVTEPGEGTYTYDEGDVVNLVATPDAGYQFVNWTGDVGTIADVNAAATTITMDGDYSITANFMAVAIYDLTISSTTGGLVTTPGEGPFTYSSGTGVNLVATPYAGYRFINWTGDVSTIADVNAASTTVTMNGNYSITANFEEGAVTFADPNLEAAVREAIAIPEGPIYPSDLEGLTSLSASVKNIADLTGLECATSLTLLLLRSNQISDVSPLANLTSLAELGLGGNQISDISALANLVNLEVLSLGNNQISDISTLANLTSLTKLWLCYNQISDIGPLVENEEFSTGDYVCLKGNPLSPDSRNIYIPQLKARGVKVVSQ